MAVLFHLFPILVAASLSACLPPLQSPDSGGILFSPSLLCNLTGDCASQTGTEPGANTEPWARTVTGGGGDSEFKAVVYDRKNRVIYAAGYIKGNGTFNFGKDDHGIDVTVTGDSTGGRHPVIVKYELDGTPRWARTVTSTQPMSSAEYNALAVNSRGDVFAAGHIWGKFTVVDFGGVSATGSALTFTAVVVKYDSDGNAKWAKAPAYAGFDYTPTSFNAIAIDASDNIIVAGWTAHTDPMDYGNGVIVSGGVYDRENIVFVKYKFNSNGSNYTASWGNSSYGGTSENRLRGIAVDPTTGGIYVAGYQRGTGINNYGVVNNNPVELHGPSNYDNLLLLHYNADGAIQWGHTVSTDAGTGDKITSFYDVAVDASGNVCAVGKQTGTIEYNFGLNGTNPIKSQGAGTGDNAALVCYNPSSDPPGAPVRALTTEDIVNHGDSSVFHSVTVDSANNILTAGCQHGTGSYGYGPGVSARGSFVGSNPILVKYNSDGTPLWARSTIGGAGDSCFHSVTTDGTNVYAVGFQTGDGSYTYSPGATATGDHTGRNAVIVKYSP